MTRHAAKLALLACIITSLSIACSDSGDTAKDAAVDTRARPDVRGADIRSPDTRAPDLAPPALKEVRVLFMVDTTNGMDLTDPFDLRIKEPKRAFALLTSTRVKTAFAVMKHADTGTLLQDFSTDASALNAAADKLATASGDANFIASLGVAKTTLEADMKRSRGVPNEQTAYVVFFYADNLPRDTANILKAVADLKTLADDNKVMAIRFHTGLLIDPSGFLDDTVHDAIILTLRQMARQANGQFRDYLEGETFDFNTMIQAPLR